MEPIILCGPTAKHFKTFNGGVDFQRFPSGESYAQIKENIRGRDTFVVQSICAPANDSLMDLLVVGDAARRASAGRLTAVCPFLGYMRSDRKDKPRIAISAKLVMNMLEAAGYQRILTMDVHTLQAQGFTDLPFDHLFSYPIFADYLNYQGLNHPHREKYRQPMAFVAPDIGATKRAQAYAEKFGCGFAIVNKKRLSPHEVKACDLVGDVHGLDVVITDDLTESANTLIEAAKICKKYGAATVRVAVTHCCLTKEGEENLMRAIQEKVIDAFITTNTIGYDSFPFRIEHANAQFVCLDVEPLLIEAIRGINRNESISSLFEVKGY